MPEDQEYIEYEDFEVEVPKMGITTVLVVFTTLFLLLGILLMGYELYSVYGFFGQPNAESSESRE